MIWLFLTKHQLLITIEQGGLQQHHVDAAIHYFNQEGDLI